MRIINTCEITFVVWWVARTLSSFASFTIWSFSTSIFLLSDFSWKRDSWTLINSTGNRGQCEHWGKRSVQSSTNPTPTSFLLPDPHFFPCEQKSPSVWFAKHCVGKFCRFNFKDCSLLHLLHYWHFSIGKLSKSFAFLDDLAKFRWHKWLTLQRFWLFVHFFCIFLQ